MAMVKLRYGRIFRAVGPRTMVVERKTECEINKSGQEAEIRMDRDEPGESLDRTTNSKSSSTSVTISINTLT